MTNKPPKRTRDMVKVERRKCPRRRKKDTRRYTLLTTHTDGQVSVSAAKKEKTRK